MAENGSPKAFLVPAPLFQAVLSYLQQHPFAQVAQMITMLAQCQAAPSPASPISVVPGHPGMAAALEE